MRSKVKRIIILSVFSILVCSIIILFITETITFKKDVNIDKILESEDYAYLSLEAKSYLKGYYEETGEILLTEKNKKENTIYLNPEFVDYLGLSDEEKKSVSIIPEETVIDYLYDESNAALSNEELPSKFDLRDVDGKNFVTPVKNQGKLGLCWAFATNAQVESYFLVKNNENYEEGKSQLFSERQIDYATSVNGIDNFTSRYAERFLGSGGNFNIATGLMLNQVSLVDNSWKEYNDTDYEKMQLYQVLNYQNSKYEVNETVNMPRLNISELDLTKEEDVAKKDSYLNTIKEYIMNYGGAYVGTDSPTYSCSSKISSTDNKYLIREDENCLKKAPHALQIIGWDDNLEYSYCAVNNRHYSASDSKCNEENTVEGKGVWILKNSWGDIEPFAYLAYDSLNSNISLITNISKASDKNWDFSYVKANKPIKTNGSNEKVVKIKFLATTQNSDYNVYLFNGRYGKKITSVYVTLPGVYEVDLSDKEIYLNDGEYFLVDSSMVYLYTKIEDNNQFIKTKDATYKNDMSTNNGDNYNLYVYSDTQNISSNEIIDYELYDMDGNDLSQYLNYKYNYVAENNVNSLLTISSSVLPGTYILKTKYNNDIKCESNIILRTIKEISGSGTSTDPYVITTPDELAMINDDLNAYYVLGNDIDLTEATQNENGIFYNDGKGWIPIGAEVVKSFSGNFDGKGYKIKGLYKKNSDYNGGLFYQISYESNNDIQIKNIVFEDCFINSRTTYHEGSYGWVSYEGILAFMVRDSKNGYYTSDDVSITIDNIAIKNSEISGYGDTGGLIGILVSAKKDSIFISNIFSDSKVTNSNVYLNGSKSGIIGYAAVQTNFEQDANLNINNIMNIGLVGVDVNILTDYTYERSTNYYFGGIIGKIAGPINLYNVINTSEIIEDTKYNQPLPYGTMLGNVFKNDNFSGIGELSNIYYTLDREPIFNSETEVTLNNISKKTIKELTNPELYTNWDGFEENWKMETIDGIPRIPVLKFVDFEYTKIDDINLGINESVNIYDLITPSTDLAKNITYEVKDTDIATIDNEGNIMSHKYGKTTIHVLSYYDGYEKDVEIIVKPTIVFDANTGNGTMEKQLVNYDSDEKINKNEFNKEGYKFKEWNTEKDGSGTSFNDEDSTESMVFENQEITLYAIWTPITYKVKYDANSGTGLMESQTFTYDETSSLNKNTFEKEGYIFKEWNTEKDGSGTAYSDEQAVKNLSNEENADITLYAQWIKEENLIVFDANGGTGEMEEQTFTYDVSQKINKNTFTRNGYSFKNWNTLQDGSGKSYSDEQSIKISEDITLYAIWEENSNYVINKYTIDESNKYIDFIDVNTTVNEFKKNITTTGEIRIEVDYKTVNNKNLLYTGGKTKIYKNNQLYKEYTNIIRGDVNGDGVVGIIDYIRIMKDIMGITKLSGVYKQAADVNQNNKIDIIDYIRIMKMIMEGN